MKTKEETRAYNAAWRAANPEKIRAAWRSATAAYYVANSTNVKAHQKEYRVASQGKIAERKRMKLYGVSPDCFQLMLAVQQNACNICKEPFSKPPHVDHDHKTGEVRGLLCSRCNQGLGLFRESIEFLDNAKEYLQGYK